MAKLSVVLRNEKRKVLSQRHWKKRQELRDIASDPKVSWEKRMQAQKKLQQMPRDTSVIRVRNRCAKTGRPRGVYRKVGLARQEFRIRAMAGEIPGLVVSSW